jgi:hypothetical protein
MNDKRFALLIGALVPIAIAIGACGKKEEQPYMPPAVVTDTAQVNEGPVSITRIRLETGHSTGYAWLLKLEDGSRCLVHREGKMSCSWSSK